MDTRKGQEALGGELTSRERFNRCMRFQSVDWVPHYEFGYWDGLKLDWLEQGCIPQELANENGHVPDDALEGYFGCETMDGFGPRIGAGPGRKREILEETEDKITYRDGLGVVCQEKKEGIRSIPHYIDFPIKKRSDWEAFREEFLVLDADWRTHSKEAIIQARERSRASKVPFVCNFGSFIGWIRNWTGFENLAYMVYDDPDLVEEMVDHVGEMVAVLQEPILEEVSFDAGAGWEDICFNSGPLLSPQFFTTVILPRMKPVIQSLRQRGIQCVWTDCDGNVEKLVPIWLEAGINCLFPAEVKAGNDLFALRKEYGRDLLIRGGFDKLVLLQSKEAILGELKRLEPLIAEGGCIPHVDHRTPGGVRYDLYCYYVWEKCHLLGMPKEKIRNIPAFRDSPVE